MAITIQPYRPEHVPAVVDLNRRLLAGGATAEVVFPESAVPKWLPKLPGSPAFNEFFVAIDGDGVIRGAYALKWQQFSFQGSIRQIGFYHHPVSEGIVNPAYPQLGFQMLRSALRSSPVLLCLGMGGYERPLPRMLSALKWNHCLVPFRFKVVHPARFLRRIGVLRASPIRAACADAAAWTGLGWLALRGAQALRTHRPAGRVEYDIVPEFGSWAGDIWERTHAKHAMIAVRDPDALSVLYPRANSRFTRVLIRRDGVPVGWAVVGQVQQKHHEQYGDMRVGWILDGMAEPGHADAVIWSSARVLEESGADLVLSNQSHPEWVSALDRAGFWKAGSNYVFAASPQLAEILGPFGDAISRVHLNRGDGDNLYQYL